MSENKNRQTPSEKIVYSTVQIKCTYADGSSGTGTGYFFKFLEDIEKNEYVPVVITNKHVIKNAKFGTLILNTTDDINEPIDTSHYDMKFENFEYHWRKHPDQDVDLCALPIADAIMEAHRKGVKLYWVPLDKSLIPSSEDLSQLSALENILMVGYPNGLWDYVNNKPIFRNGITATHPCRDYCGKKEFMIDAACFPGSSGSPVFIFDEGMHLNKRRGIASYGNRIMLLGTLYAGPQHTATGEIKIINIPTSQVPIAISTIPNNLGFVIKSERILELENLFR